jgi:methyltransferase (TIGR00027 family)
MTSGGAPEGVGRTAIGMALVRSEETKRSDRLFEDPYAAAFVDAAPDAFAEEEADADRGVLSALGAAFAFNATVRTRFYDEYLTEASGAGCHQVVLVAAGLDTRAFRLGWPVGTRLFELDLPEVLTFKERVLEANSAVPRCDRAVVVVDLRSDWRAPLTDSGFEAAVPTAWLVEGLLTYLSAEEAARFLLGVTELSAPRSRVAFEQDSGVSSSLVAQARGVPSMERYTAMFKGGLGDSAPAWLKDHGWQVAIHNQLAVASTYGRTPPPNTSGGFVTGVR